MWSAFDAHWEVPSHPEEYPLVDAEGSEGEGMVAPADPAPEPEPSTGAGDAVAPTVIEDSQALTDTLPESLGPVADFSEFDPHADAQPRCDDSYALPDDTWDPAQRIDGEEAAPADGADGQDLAACAVCGKHGPHECADADVGPDPSAVKQEMADIKTDLLGKIKRLRWGVIKTNQKHVKA